MDESIAETISKTGSTAGCGCGGPGSDGCGCGASATSTAETYSDYTAPTGSTAVNIPTCRFCGEASHGSVFCALIKEVEYYPDGSIKRVALTR